MEIKDEACFSFPCGAEALFRSHFYFKSTLCAEWKLFLSMVCLVLHIHSQFPFPVAAGEHKCPFPPL